MSSASGLSTAHRIRARDLAVDAALLGLHHAPELHYTQGTKRWEGIHHDLKAWRGEYPRNADCSAFATWCLWNGLDHYGVRDVVNDDDWRAGYTGSMHVHGRLVVHHENILRGDLVLYGDPYGPTGHVAIAIGSGLVISFGSEAGPFKLPMGYRDVTEVRRFI